MNKSSMQRLNGPYASHRSQPASRCPFSSPSFLCRPSSIETQKIIRTFQLMEPGCYTQYGCIATILNSGRSWSKWIIQPTTICVRRGWSGRGWLEEGFADGRVVVRFKSVREYERKMWSYYDSEHCGCIPQPNPKDTSGFRGKQMDRRQCKSIESNQFLRVECTIAVPTLLPLLPG